MKPAKYAPCKLLSYPSVCMFHIRIWRMCTTHCRCTTKIHFTVCAWLKRSVQLFLFMCSQFLRLSCSLLADMCPSFVSFVLGWDALSLTLMHWAFFEVLSLACRQFGHPFWWESIYYFFFGYVISCLKSGQYYGHILLTCVLNFFGWRINHSKLT